MRIYLSLFRLYLQTCALTSKISVQGQSLETLVNKEFVCNNDNVFRALKAKSGSASLFCSSLIDIPVSTILKSAFPFATARDAL